MLSVAELVEPEIVNQNLTDKKSQIEDLATKFESLFMNILMKSMRSTVTKSKLVDGGNAEDIYQGMLDNEYALVLAKNSKSSFSLSKLPSTNLLKATQSAIKI